jgi:phenylalanyl-tRNA synthetase beta subunit
MKFSLAWLQTYSKEPLPSIQKLEETITFNAFEIEEVTKVGEDTILDIKVLPNRAHDALGHRGMARDIVALVGNTFIDPNEYYNRTPDSTVLSPVIVTEDIKACPRFMSVRIDGISVTPSPEWLQQALAAIGQKSINSIVDITNYVQFALNKPMHAYDAALIFGNKLSARFAKTGEKLTTLDDKELVLDEATLVISDTEKPLGLAGIKGGKFSGISQNTTSIILESANFNPTLIRKTAQKYGIRTDASKRFENEISDSLVEDGLRMTIALVKKLNPNARVGELVDISNRKKWDYVVSVSTNEVNTFLGTSYNDSDIEEVWTRLGFSVEKMTAKEMVEQKLALTNSATYKNPSSIRTDAPEMFSCSSLMSFIFAGIWQPSISIDKYVYGMPVEEGDAKWGDLVFSNTGFGKIRFETVAFLPGTKVTVGIDHVGLYIGDGKVIHISRRTNAVITESISESKNFKQGAQYARLVDVDEQRFFVTAPAERLDIRIKEDLIEEVARMKGLSSIKGVLPKLTKTGTPHKRLYYENIIKNILHTHGFSEIMTYSFGNEGEVEIMKGLATDKEKLRSSLSSGVQKAFQMNMLNAPLLNIQTIKMYEFGNVFTQDSERRHLALIIDDGKKKSSFVEEVQMILSDITTKLSVASLKHTVLTIKPYVLELDFDTLIEALPEPTKYEPLTHDTNTISYKAVSAYPFITRDIALWVPFGTTWETISSLCAQVWIPLVVRVDLFDTFEKEIDGVQKISFAFRIVFQSYEKTLTDEEVNEMMNPYYELLKEQGYEIR